MTEKMPERSTVWVRNIRDALRRGGSREHAKGVQWFFKEEVRSHGWYTADLRRFARQTSREIQKTDSLPVLVEVAGRLFTGKILEEKVFAVLLLENSVARFGEREFKLFESWLDRVTSWADHDGLVHYLIGPLVAAEPRRTARAFRWTKSRNRWRRRCLPAAAPSLRRVTEPGRSTGTGICRHHPMTPIRAAFIGVINQ